MRVKKKSISAFWDKTEHSLSAFWDKMEHSLSAFWDKTECSPITGQKQLQEQISETLT